MSGKFYFKYETKTGNELTVARETLNDLIDRAKEIMQKHEIPHVRIRQTVEVDGRKTYPDICRINAKFQLANLDTAASEYEIKGANVNIVVQEEELNDKVAAFIAEHNTAPKVSKLVKVTLTAVDFETIYPNQAQ